MSRGEILARSLIVGPGRAAMLYKGTKLNLDALELPPAKACVCCNVFLLGCWRYVESCAAWLMQTVGYGAAQMS